MPHESPAVHKAADKATKRFINPCQIQHLRYRVHVTTTSGGINRADEAWSAACQRFKPSKGRWQSLEAHKSGMHAYKHNVACRACIPSCLLPAWGQTALMLSVPRVGFVVLLMSISRANEVPHHLLSSSKQHKPLLERPLYYIINILDRYWYVQAWFQVIWSLSIRQSLIFMDGLELTTGHSPLVVACQGSPARSSPDSRGPLRIALERIGGLFIVLCFSASLLP